MFKFSKEFRSSHCPCPLFLPSSRRLVCVGHPLNSRGHELHVNSILYIRYMYILDCWNLLIPGCPRNVKKLTKAPLFLDSMKSLDLPPDPQHFTNSMKVAKRKKSPSLIKCLFVFRNILTMSEICRSEIITDDRNDTCSYSLL